MGKLLLTNLALILGLILVVGGVGLTLSEKIYLNNNEKNTIVKAETTAIPTINHTKNEYAFRVVKVIDGDTIELEGGIKVRYIGIDSPEINDGDNRTECFGEESFEENMRLVEGKDVILTKDVSDVDKYNRWLRYAYIDGIFVNDYLVKNGFANASSYPPDVKFQELFRKSEEAARMERNGLWAGCKRVAEPTVILTKISTPDITQTEDRKCEIKGNINGAGDKIFHIPGCNSYDKTAINMETGEKWFCTEEEAILAGWRKAKNCN